MKNQYLMSEIHYVLSEIKDNPLKYYRDKETLLIDEKRMHSPGSSHLFDC